MQLGSNLDQTLIKLDTTAVPLACTQFHASYLPLSRAPQATCLAAGSNSEKRLWLHAAATEHAFVAHALPSILPSLADDHASCVATNTAKALRMLC